MRGVIDEEAGRASALSVPHVLHLEGDTLVAAPHPAVRAHVADARSSATDGFEATLAAGEAWSRRTNAGTLAIRRDEFSITCSWLDAVTVLPASAGDVRILVDGETVELFSGAALFGVGSDSAFTVGAPAHRANATVRQAT